MNNKRSVKLLFLFAFIASSVQASIVSFGLISYSPNGGSVFSLPPAQNPAPPPPVQNTFTAVGDPVYPLVGNTTVYKAPTTVSSITPDPYAITLDTQAAVLNRQLVTNYNTPIVATNAGFDPAPTPSYASYGFSYTTPYSSSYSYAGYGSLIASNQFTGYYNPPTPPLVVTGAQTVLWTSGVSATTFSSGGGIVTGFDTAPEPATLVLFGVGIGSLLIYHRKRIAAQRQE